MPRHVLRLLTYNIHKGFSTGNARFVLHGIRQQLEQLDLDLVLLQEIQGEHAARAERIRDWPDAAQFEYLADELWPHYAYGKNAIYDQGHHGNAILSRYPFVRWENINVSSLKRASRSLLHGVIRFPETAKVVHIICIHLDLVAYERERQLAILSQRIDSHVPHHEPLIIAGDFNDWRGRAEEHLHDDLDLTEAFHDLTGRYARSFPAWLPMLPVDRIYYRGVKPVTVECLKGPPWRNLSDHTPLYAAFEL